MSNLYQVKLERLAKQKQRLDDLTADYQAISDDISSTISSRDRQRLERDLKQCEKEMERVAEVCDRLEAELQKFQSKVDETQTLIDLLSPIPFEVVIKIYRNCLAEGRARSIPDTLEALVQQLTDLPKDLLVRFIGLLIQEPIEQRDALKAWVIQQGMTLPEAEVRTAEICLMIKVKTRGNPSLGYLVEAAISQDPDPWDSTIEPTKTPIPIPFAPDPKRAPGYAQEDLPQILDHLIATCGSQYQIPLSDLVIQWFLPIELMSLPLEHWQIQIGRIQKQCNGLRCKAVIVRSSDRQYYLSASGDWKKYWMRLLECRASRCFQTLESLDPIKGRTTINWIKTQVVGCKFVEHHELQKQEMLWDELLGQGLPVALWMRQSKGDAEKAKKVMQSVTKCSIAELPDSLARHRQKALSHDCETDRLEAASLCLLLDNPFRPFPTIDYQSA
ncbi:MAG: hypothetical protein J0L70_02630 [Leptolyngbya sp. UWPOB_LEPTO1]|uniref:VMAP-C domain-containing protein n=1 Tax=Leptolyngbya sp. UWPOB_LEPTO1 TaxID=2815653 RepID=UPI001AD10F25|nr:hypothetical protein [Leptolyngbya sp. UWPOB_LEPTO1]MBN8559399.1 hypothetical protein [Leptolyngbya sp. UWPOB_LEPTO1]